MAQLWIRTRRKIFVLAMIGVAARLLSPILDRGRRNRHASGSTLPIRQVLVVELGNIGDIVLLLPFLAALRERFPGCSISLLARPFAREILHGTGLVDELLSAEGLFPKSGSTYNLPGYDWRRLRGTIRELRGRRFDLAFQCRPHIREHLLLRLSGAQRTIGYAFGVGERFLTDALPRDEVHRHKSDDWLRLLAPFGGAGAAPAARLHVTGEERGWVDRFLGAHSVAQRDRIVGIHPGASVAEKRWPVERFAAVAAALSGTHDVRVLAFADPYAPAQALPSMPRAIAVREPLRHLIALLERCTVLVCNDSGPMHLAAALGVPTVAIFGPGDPRWFGPLGDGHRVVLTPDRTDVAGVTVAEVVAAVDAALRERRAADSIPSGCWR